MDYSEISTGDFTIVFITVYTAKLLPSHGRFQNNKNGAPRLIYSTLAIQAKLFGGDKQTAV